MQSSACRSAAIPDYLALVGDAADGIPGIPRWGARSTALCMTYPLRYSLDRIPADAGDWDVKVRGSAEGLAKSLAEQRDDALLYRRLATLRLDVPLAGNRSGTTALDRCVRQPDFADLCQSFGLESPCSTGCRNLIPVSHSPPTSPAAAAQRRFRQQ